jgi:hypothetical protein
LNGFGELGRNSPQPASGSTREKESASAVFVSGELRVLAQELLHGLERTGAMRGKNRVPVDISILNDN